MSGAPLPLDQSFDQPAGLLWAVSPLIRRIVAPNAGPMTFSGTCTYVVGHGDVAVIDPGPDMPSHIEAIRSALAGETISRIFVTHTHRDHSPGARLLQDATGAPILGCAVHAPARPPRGREVDAVAASTDLAYQPDRVLADGEIIDCAGFSLQAIATPGHTMNHLAFALARERAVFSGDHVMAWSTTVVAPPSGSMAAYMDSLAKLRRRNDAILWPGHGPPVTDPARFMRALQHHRRQREHAILSWLSRGEASIPEIVAGTYEKLDPRLHKAAAASVFAHLEDLCARGEVEAGGTDGYAAVYALKR